MKKTLIALPLAALLVACGSNTGGGGGGSSGDIRIVGSSTVYPFTKAVAEDFMRANAGTNVTVESTGTGAGMKLFCAGVGSQHPDIEDASRAIKKSEYDDCVKNGVKTIIEVPVGIDGLTVIESTSGPAMNLTQADIYKALAANPFGKGPNTAKTWKDVNPSLPAIKIRVLGPPPTSGTRDSLADLYLEKGCDTDPAMKELKKSNEDEHKKVCTKIREDGAYVEAGENDNLMVQKVSVDPGTLGILGFSYLDENADKVRPVQIAGVTPSEETIANLSYPGARRLFVYIKGEHLQAKPKLKDFVAQYAKMWGTGGKLERIGLVPFGGADADAAAKQAGELKPLDPSTLK
ncbi:MAG TPA: substrate-binding domain-containing protein [Sphingomicrobium sp.]|nr:substrate-binding domain-containing protein [Sphingomicrobium sp.]